MPGRVFVFLLFLLILLFLLTQPALLRPLLRLEAPLSTSTPHPTLTPTPTLDPLAALPKVTPSGAGAAAFSLPPVVEAPLPAGPTAVAPPALLKSVSPETVPAGQTSPITWTLTFSNPTSQTVGGVVVADPLPPGLVYQGNDTTQGQVQVTGDLSQTLIVATLGDVPPGGQATIGIVTRVISQTAAGTIYPNTARYTTATLPPAASNEARVTVVGQTAFLPVTGGILDPRTPAGRMTWGGAVVVLLLGLKVARSRGARERRSRGEDKR